MLGYKDGEDTVPVLKVLTVLWERQERKKWL